MKLMSKRGIQLALIGLVGIVGNSLTGCGSSGSPNLILDIATGQSAAVEIVGFSNPTGRSTVVDGNLYVSDAGNNRIVIFDGIPSANISANDPSNSVLPGGAGYILNGPTSVASDSGILAIADTGANRVLVWDEASTAGITTPDWIIGLDTDCDADGLLNPQGVFVYNQTLMIADTGHNRVLVHVIPDVVAGEEGAGIHIPATLVLGQTDLVSCAINIDGNVAANTLSSPTDAWSDGIRVVITDSANNRVLVWETIPTTGEDADVVVGQADFSTVDGSGVIENGPALSNPIGASSNGVNLFVADTGNNRVLQWEFLPTIVTPQTAKEVLGQADFTSTGSGNALYEMNAPTGAIANASKILVNDSGNNRYLIFNGN